MTDLAADPVPDLNYTAGEGELQTLVRDVVGNTSPWQQVLVRTEAADQVDAKLWRRLRTGIGCVGLPVAQDNGGAGASWREAGVVMEELGAAVAAVPYLGSAVCATALAEYAGARTLLGQLASGLITAALAVPFTTAAYAEIARSVSMIGGMCSGVVEYVADAAAADVLLVPTVEGPLIAVAANNAAVRCIPVVSLDMTRPLCVISFDDAPAVVVGEGDAMTDAIERALLVTTAMLASEQVGVADRCLRSTVDHLRHRRGFGSTSSRYQGFTHRLADMWLELAQARAAARYAADCAATDSRDLPLATALAKATCSEVVVRAAQECIQLHVGIGFTWEHPAHLYLCRAKSSALAMGNAEWHRSRIGDLVGIAV